MAPRTAPTERQRRLGSELRKMRTSAGVTADEAAQILGLDRAKISNIETGVRSISPERLRTLAAHCDCRNEAYVEALIALSRPRTRGWWERYRSSLPQGLLDIAELESYAVRMRTAHTAHIPGMFQTTEHALELFRAVLPPLPEQEIALRLAFRVERQQLLEKENPPEYVGVVHEAALRMQFGGRDTARAQLEHLLAASARPQVRFLVVPFAAGTFPGSGQTVNYFEGLVPELDTAQVDSAHGVEFLGDKDQLDKYRAHLDWLEGMALAQDQSQDFIRHIVREL